MAATTNTKKDKCAEILDSACARNLPVEIHYTNSEDELVIARSRILAVDEENVFLDSPSSDAGSYSPERGQEISAFLLLNKQRLCFDTHVTKSRCFVDLNEQTKVAGFAVSRPKKVGEAQRRQDFRMSVASISHIEVRMHGVLDSDTHKCPIDSVRFHGALVDISRGGICVTVDASQRQKFVTREQIFADFLLPQGHGEIVMLSELRHVKQILNGDANKIGLRFVPWNPQFTKPQIQTISRFCADLQRQMAKRSR